MKSNNCPSSLNKHIFKNAQWLEKRIEWHILGNHLFANGKALLFAGLFFSGKQAEIWLKKGLTIISKELDEQILTDGGHFELSPMYHAIFLEDLLDLINFSKNYLSKISKKKINLWIKIVKNMLLDPPWKFRKTCLKNKKSSHFNSIYLHQGKAK